MAHLAPASWDWPHPGATGTILHYPARPPLLASPGRQGQVWGVALIVSLVGSPHQVPHDLTSTSGQCGQPPQSLAWVRQR